MRKILTVCDSWKLKPDTIAPVHGARLTYLNAITKRALIPILVPSIMSNQVIDELYNLCDGVLFMGGRDINPAFYNESKHEKTEIEPTNRDTVELYILKKVLRDKKPFLGICRGSQMLAVATGGTLYQHVPEVVKMERHDPGEQATYEDVPQNRHDIIIDKSSRIYQIIKNEKINVNSGHHQSVKTLGNSLKVSATSPEGVVEMTEHQDSSFFCFGVQCHPEADIDGPLEPLLDAFAKAVLDKKNGGVIS